MTGSTHLTAGFAMGFGLCAITQPSPAITVATIFTTAICSLLPDIDTASSKVGYRIAPLSWLVRIIFGHRQFFHSLLCWIIISVTAWLFGTPPIIAISIFAGAASHLLLDMLNPSGVQLLWPLPQRIILARFRCDGLIDKLLTLFFTGITIWLTYLCTRQYL